MSSPSGGLGRFLGLYYGYAFLFDFIFAYAIYTAMFSLEGISTTQIGMLLAFWSASAIVLEMPSGALSDHFDRRVLLVAAPLVKALTFVLWGMAGGNVWLYGLGFLCWSAGQALQSGTREALLFERLELVGRREEFDKLLGRDNAAESLGIGAGTLVGGFVAQAGMEMSVWWSIAPLLLGSVLALGLVDERRERTTDDGESPVTYLSHFADAIREFRRHAELRFVAIYVACGLIVFELIEEFDQLYYLAVSVPIWLWGVLAAVVEGMYALSSMFAYRLGGRPWLAWALPLAGGALFVVAAFGNSPWFVLFLELAYILVAPAAVLAEARFNRVMDGTSRATTISALVMGENVAGIVGTLAVGILADRIGILPTYGWAGLLMLPLAIWIILGQRRGMRATD